MSSDHENLHGIDVLRRAVKCFDNCNETFNQGFTARELVAVFEYLLAHPELHDCSPDCWREITIQVATRVGDLRATEELLAHARNNNNGLVTPNGCGNAHCAFCYGSETP